MNDIIGYLQARIAEIKSDLQTTTEQLQRLNQDRQMLTNELQGYEQTLTGEIRRQSGGLQTMVGDQLPLADNAQISIDNLPHGVQKPADMNKAEFARQYIRDHAAVGVTPTSLYDGFVAAQIPIKKPYIYSLMLRLVGQGAITIRRGKYYPLTEPGGE